MVLKRVVQELLFFLRFGRTVGPSGCTVRHFLRYFLLRAEWQRTYFPALQVQGVPFFARPLPDRAIQFLLPVFFPSVVNPPSAYPRHIAVLKSFFHAPLPCNYPCKTLFRWAYAGVYLHRSSDIFFSHSWSRLLNHCFFTFVSEKRIALSRGIVPRLSEWFAFLFL